jgi:hypothetical protein
MASSNHISASCFCFDHHGSCTAKKVRRLHQYVPSCTERLKAPCQAGPSRPTASVLFAVQDIKNILQPVFDDNHLQSIASHQCCPGGEYCKLQDKNSGRHDKHPLQDQPMLLVQICCHLKNTLSPCPVLWHMRSCHVHMLACWFSSCNLLVRLGSDLSVRLTLSVEDTGATHTSCMLG